jgi:hypothetical protein
VVGFRAGVLFGHASCFDLGLMQTVSGLLKTGAQPSIALGQALHVLASATKESSAE